MIPYEELDRALARWKAKAQGGVPEAPPLEAAPPTPISEATPMEIDEMGSVPQPVEPPERTGEIDLAELETYED
ncbi:MAG TPA: hypothetical protein VI456_08420 [Polyangia bacterium]